MQEKRLSSTMLSPVLLSCVFSVLMEDFVLMLNSFDCHHLVAYRGRAAFVMPVLCTERQEFSNEL